MRTQSNAGRGVLLVSMPFGPVFAPSLGLSLLKAELGAIGVPASIRYFTIDFAERIGERVYSGVAQDDRPALVALAGEWLFSRALFGARPDDERAYVDEVLVPAGTSASDIQRLLRARRHVEPFLDACVREIAARRPRIVGFTSVFQQHVASLALAKRLRRALPDLFLMVGGANCEGVMGAETLRQFPFLDAVVSGEGDLVVPELVNRVVAGKSASDLPGVRTRDRLSEAFAFGNFSNGPVVRRLDDLPRPDYGDYFDQFRASRFAGDWQPAVFFESSRGCWWGERAHCTFCGLNGSTMAFRSKSAERALDEIAALAKAHPGCDIQVVDNILDMGYFDTMLPQLAARKLGIKLFYETKSNLKKDQIRSLRDSGVLQIQPGIESFSNAVLKLMRKGVSGLQNIQLLKWCAELGVEPVWNLLWGFPGEPAADYARMAELVPLLSHLTPPGGAGPLRLDRFSPNFTDAEALGLTDVKPLPPYRHVYPFAAGPLANLAYYFSFRYREPRDVNGYVAPLARSVQRWKRASARSALFAVDVDGTLAIWDLRPASRAPLTVLRGLDRALYLACDAACDVAQLAARAESLGEPVDVDARLAPLVQKGLLIREGSRYLALAIPLGQHRPPERVLRRFYKLARRLEGRRTASIVVRTRPRPGRRALRVPSFALNKQGELIVR